MRVALFVLEQILNIPFRIDPEARAELAVLAGRSMRVVLTHPAQSFDLVFTSDDIQVRPSEGTPNATVRGSALQLATLMRARPEQTQKVAASGLTMEGDIDTAWAIKRLFENASVDWQETLASAMGDVPAQIIARGLRRAYGSLRYAMGRQAANAVVFLQDEERVLLRPFEMDEFLAAVDVLRDDVERLGLRVRRLKAH